MGGGAPGALNAQLMIYLIRHADAVSTEENRARPLSAKGRDQVARVCVVLRREPGFNPTEIWHSPLVRSLETAELLARELKLRVPLVLKPGLEPDDDPGKIAAILEEEKREIAVVGHEPHLGILASMMVHGPARAGIFFPFPKAGVLALSRDAKRWRSSWLVRSP
jgi:phosphohistidine phosphatase